MPERDALHRRQAREGQEVGIRLHADILEEQHIQFQLGDALARLGQLFRQDQVMIGGIADEAGNLVIDEGRHKQRHALEAGFIQFRDQAACGAADTVPAHELREEAHFDAAAGRARALAMRCGPQ